MPEAFRLTLLQNILIASPTPIWVKIADFGVSKREKNTVLRTMCGTPGYLAPELLGILPKELRLGYTYTNALDIWSLGCLVHEILASQTPFLETDPEILESGLSISDLEIDMDFLYQYCRGQKGFPTDALQSSQVSEGGINFVKSLLAANPKYRPTATSALRSPWLAIEQCNWYGKLKSEFLHLGLDLAHGERGPSILIRQGQKADIMRFLPPSAKKDFSTLLQEAMSKGYNSALLALLQSPSSQLIDHSVIRKSFQQAIKAENLDAVKVFLEKKKNIYVRIQDQEILRWVVESGHVDILEFLLKKK